MTKQTKILPSNGYILLEIAENETSTKLIIVDSDQVPQRGKVLAVGGPIYYEGTDIIFKAPCKAGDTIIHSGYGFENIKSEGKQYRLCPFIKVLAVIQK